MLPCIAERTILTYHGQYFLDIGPKSYLFGHCHPFQEGSGMDRQFEFDWDMLMSHSCVEFVSD